MTYYDQNAKLFFDNTVSVDMSGLYDEFLPLVPKAGHILDAGCGTGRDSKAFIERGYQVYAMDASAEMALLAEQLIGQAVEVISFQAFKPPRYFDAIWACASLLHIRMQDLPETMNELSKCLNADGFFYCSFKYGQEEVTRDGRHFTNLNEQLLESIVGDSLKIAKTWVTTDLRPERNEKWLNAILIRC